jgi:hypothetical protein
MQQDAIKKDTKRIRNGMTHLKDFSDLRGKGLASVMIEEELPHRAVLHHTVYQRLE